MNDHQLTAAGMAVLREPAFCGDETGALLGSLERQRRTFAWKCSGLDAEQIRRTVAASTLSIGGLVKHLTYCEDGIFFGKFRAETRLPALADEDDQFRLGPGDTPDSLLAGWREAVDRSRHALAAALAGDGFDTATKMTWGGESANLRRLMVDLIEEYARHVGHADLIRESIDGLVGEDPPPTFP